MKFPGAQLSCILKVTLLILKVILLNAIKRALRIAKRIVMLVKFRRAAEFGLLRASILYVFGISIPMVMGFMLFPFLNYLLILLTLGWIPYSIWLALCYYYKRKDQIIEDGKRF